MAYIKDEEIEIVKRIETPRRGEEVEEEILYTNEVVTQNIEYQEEEEETSSNKILPILFGITTIGIMGYLGLNYLKKDPTNITSTNSKQEVTTYIEELAIKKDSYKIEEDVIAELSTIKNQIESKKQQEISKPITKNIENHSKEIAQKEVVVPKEEIAKQELIIHEEKVAPKELVDPKEKIAKKEEIDKQELILQMKEIEEDEMVISKERIVPEEKITPKEKIVPKKIIKKSRLQYETIKPNIYTVKKGDSLVSISKRFYGNPMDYRRIIYANSRIRSKKTPLHFGAKIIIPRKDNKTTRRFIIVEKGDTLASISKEIYGSRDKILKIVRANYRIKTKHSTLHIGQKVYVPK